MELKQSLSLSYTTIDSPSISSSLVIEGEAIANENAAKRSNGDMVMDSSNKRHSKTTGKKAAKGKSSKRSKTVGNHSNDDTPLDIIDTTATASSIIISMKEWSHELRKEPATSQDAKVGTVIKSSKAAAVPTFDRNDITTTASSSIHPMRNDRYNLRIRYEQDVLFVAMDTSANQGLFRLNDDDDAKPV